MCAMGKVQVTVDEVIDMVSTRNGLMPASCTVAMSCFMAATGLAGSAVCWIRGADRKDMFIDVTFMRMMKMPVVQIVLMTFMVDRTVAAAQTMLMSM